MTDFSLLGHDLFGEAVKPKNIGPLMERFVIPPFTILDAKQGEWQDRKRAWISLGIESELGRTEGGNFGTNNMASDYVRSGANFGGNGRVADYENRAEFRLGKSNIVKGVTGHITTGTADSVRKTFEGAGTGASIFDPVLCELAYRWFSWVGAQVVDPFAGGSVRGLVAGFLGRNYWGCDLREGQVVENVRQAAQIAPGTVPQWVCGDSMEMLSGAPMADFVFSCPPYGDLEVYSDSPNDLSNMEWHTFAAAYKRIILRTVQRMKPDTFACFVVGDFRDKKGFYRNFVSTTIEAFQECGAKLYNEAILATAIGSAAMRVTNQFNAGRKLAKTHQNVLVFCNGDWRKAAQKCNANAVDAA